MKVNHKENIGKSFNRLTVLSFEYKDKYYYYNCKCSCGNLVNATSFSVINSKQRSCGCFYNESRSAKKTKRRSDLKPNGQAVARYILWVYKRNAKTRNYLFNLTNDEFYNFIKQDCHYCGRAPYRVRIFKNKNSTPCIYNGIDRVDNKIGYTLENSVPCCFICNRSKGDLSQDEFKSWVNDLVKFKTKE